MAWRVPTNTIFKGSPSLVPALLTVQHGSSEALLKNRHVLNVLEIFVDGIEVDIFKVGVEARYSDGEIEIQEEIVAQQVDVDVFKALIEIGKNIATGRRAG